MYDVAGGGAFYSCNSGLENIAEFNLSAFMDLIKGGKGKGPLVNCQDCASAVVSMSNLAGCELWCNRMGRNFETRNFLPIGFPQQIRKNFVFHEVAWEGQCGDQDLVYDACLEYDGDDTPGEEPVEYVVPSMIIFSDGNELSPFAYRERLSQNGTSGYGRCQNQNMRIRRCLR